MLRVGVLGLGAIGHVMATQFLDKSGIQLHFFNRSLRTKLHIKLFNEQLIDQDIECLTQPTSVTLDWLIICLKANHYPAAQAWFNHLVLPTTKVIIIRNGLDLAEPLLAYAPKDRILPCLIDCPTQRHPDGYYQQFQAAHLMVPVHPLSAEAKGLLENAATTLTVYPDFKTKSWEKLCASAALGAITCLSGQTCHIFEHPDLLTLFRQLLAEGMQVAKADGAQLPANYEQHQLEQLKSYPPEKGSSMLNDRLAGKLIEVEAKNGVISQLGKRYGIATPLNDHCAALLRVINKSGLHPTRDAYPR